MHRPAAPALLLLILPLAVGDAAVHPFDAHEDHRAVPLVARGAWRSIEITPRAVDLSQRAMIVEDAAAHEFPRGARVFAGGMLIDGAPALAWLRQGETFEPGRVVEDEGGARWVEHPRGWVEVESTTVDDEGWQTRAREDVDGDGARDLLVERGHWCGSNGCEHRLFLSRGSDEPRLVFDDQAYRCWISREADEGHRAIECHHRVFSPTTFILVSRIRWRGGEYVRPDPRWIEEPRTTDAPDLQVKRATEVVAFPRAPNVFVLRDEDDGETRELAPIPVLKRLRAGESFAPHGAVNDGASARWIRYSEFEDGEWIEGFVRAEDTDG